MTEKSPTSVELTPHAKSVMKRLRREGFKQNRLLERMIEWFVRQDTEFQKDIYFYRVPEGEPEAKPGPSMSETEPRKVTMVRGAARSQVVALEGKKPTQQPVPEKRK